MVFGEKAKGSFFFSPHSPLEHKDSRANDTAYTPAQQPQSSGMTDMSIGAAEGGMDDPMD